MGIGSYFTGILDAFRGKSYRKLEDNFRSLEEDNEQLRASNIDLDEDFRDAEKVNSELSKAYSDLELQCGDLKLKLAHLESKFYDIFKDRDLQAAAVGHSKLASRKALKDFAEVSRAYFELVKNAILDGYNIVSKDKVERLKGHALLINRNGVVEAISPKVRKSLGYLEDAVIDYEKLVEHEGITKLKAKKEFDELRVKLAEGYADVRNVEIIPLVGKGIYTGAVVKFNELKKLNSLRRLARKGKDLLTLVSVYNLLDKTKERIKEIDSKKKGLA